MLTWFNSLGYALAKFAGQLTWAAAHVLNSVAYADKSLGSLASDVKSFSSCHINVGTEKQI